ncbi:helix-turn-helix transcriptional regulator [Saccharomonospora saliphila]|uniref:helix-turn-helix transcriptional regulator n=1 Tax=Saccharomonospora saliphila TaxID=369829 RepID=UPI002FBE218E
MGDEPMRRDTPGRMLRLLSLLQSRRAWSGAELAERLGVTERTLRRDIDRLRALDYPVIGTTGTNGGYRLTPGNNLPPLLLADDEALAVAVGLVYAASGSIAGIDDSSLRALVKLEQVLPSRLRPQLAALTGTTTAVANRDTAQVDPNVLAVLAACSREQEIISFDYYDRAGQPSSRRIEPHSLVTVHGLWYLLAYDPDRDDWRTFRVDRIHRPSRTHRPNTPRELPAPDAGSYLARSFATASYRYTARMTVQLSADAVRAGVFGPIPGDINDDGPDRCTVRLSADSPQLVTQYVAVIAALGAQFSLEAPDEITARLRRMGRRFTE